MIRWRLFFAFVLTALFLVPLTAHAGERKAVRLDVSVKEADASLNSEWFGVYMEGKKIGWINTSRAKLTEGGKTFYREKTALSMKLTSMGIKVESTKEEVQDFEATPPFRLLRAEFKETDGAVSQKITLTAKGKGYDALMIVAGNETRKYIDSLDYTMADSMSDEVWLKRRPKKGDTIVTRGLEMEDLKLQDSTTTMLGTRETTIDGVKATVHETKTVNHSTNLESTSLYDDAGHMISTKVDIFEMRRETEEASKNTEYSTDIFLKGLAKIDRGLGKPARVTALVLEIQGEAGAILKSGPRQTVVAKGNDVFELKLGKKYGNQIKATPEEIKEALEETTAYPIHDAAVKALAKDAIGDATTDQDKVKRLCKFVNKYIEPSLSASMPKMHDLMKRKAGDCKSYALMFTCLARAVGLPSREVSGFVYMGDDDQAFGGHAWNEVLLDGCWTQVDACWNETSLDATHICLGTDKESGSALLKTFGKLNFKLVQVEGGK
jgi:protein-glutamine gamma-glutamyltransferase